MSRLARRQQKQFRLKAAVYLILFLTFIAALFFFGLKIIVSGSLYINSLIGSSEQTLSEKKPEQFYGRLNISDPPEATNSAAVAISGVVQGYTQIIITLNGMQSEPVPVKDESFTTLASPLIPGKNELIITASDTENDKNEQTETYRVYYLNTPPELELTKPDTETSTTSEQDYQIQGKTDPGTDVHVNTSPAVVDQSGGFSFLIRLKEGQNQVEVRATDKAGNETIRPLTITYQKDS